MKEIKLDARLRDTLGGWEEGLALTDDTGKPVGYVIPVDRYQAPSPPPPDPLTTAELVRNFNWQVDMIHKLWSYLMAASVATVTIAWQKDVPNAYFVLIIASVYSVYGFFGCRELVRQQRILEELERQIGREPGATDEPPTTRLGGMWSTDYFRVTPAVRVRSLYITGILAVLTAVVARAFFIMGTHGG